MNAFDHSCQAEAFLAFRAKQPHRPWEESFDFWSQSKDFEPRDRQAIRWLVWGALLGRGEATSTDLADYFTGGAA